MLTELFEPDCFLVVVAFVGGTEDPAETKRMETHRFIVSNYYKIHYEVPYLYLAVNFYR